MVKVSDVRAGKRLIVSLVTVACTTMAMPGQGADTPQSAMVRDAAAEGEQLGFYPASAFRQVRGACADCVETPPAALWYFANDLVAVPQQGAVKFNPALKAMDEVRTWAAGRQGVPEGRAPALLWLGSPQVADGKFAAEGGLLSANGETLPLSVVPRIESNRSYYDAHSQAFYAGRPVRARGTLGESGFVARTLWPRDFNLPQAPKTEALPAGASVETLVRGEAAGSAVAPMQARTLWQKNGSAPLPLAGKPVIAFMLNGAQGDDDEAHGGHFAVATGSFGPQGEWDHWLVNNFYNLGSVSEKGIIASMLPMDAYMADLNSGQAWYRPSYMLVAVLKTSAPAQMYQEAIAQVFSHFYRQDFHYRHSAANCIGINLETLRQLGWNIPKAGPESRLKAAIALPFIALRDRDLAAGKNAYDYLVAERTNLYPFVGFNAIGDDLTGRLANGGAQGGLEKQLADNLEAVLYVRIPQFPSSRALGQAPIASIDEYMNRVPKDKKDWQIVPVGPRDFPPSLMDPNTPAEDPLPSEFALKAWGAGLFGLIALGGWLGRRLLRRKKA